METRAVVALLLAAQAVGSAVYYVSHPAFFVFALVAYVYLATKLERASLVLYLAWFGWLMLDTFAPHDVFSFSFVLGYSALQVVVGVYVLSKAAPEFRARSNRAKALTLLVAVLAAMPINYLQRAGAVQLAAQSCAYTVFSHAVMHQMETRDSLFVLVASLWVLTSYWVVSAPTAVVLAVLSKSQKKVEDTVVRDVEMGKFVPAWEPPPDKQPKVNGNILRDAS